MAGRCWVGARLGNKETLFSRETEALLRTPPDDG
jgi:hypothetical protein